ncbi:MAG: PKD domain-containing protein, partial [Candidatus Syntrophoarchaeum sp.]|nr:PKD domain-containing protein [Candidatus Syntrophoarchaeum sp.]
TQFSTEQWPTYAFTDPNDVEVQFIRCSVRNKCGQWGSFTTEVTIGERTGFCITVDSSLAGKPLFVGKVYHVPITDTWFYLAMYGVIDSIGAHAQWQSIDSNEIYKVGVDIDACEFSPAPDYVWETRYGDIIECDGKFSDGDHVAVVIGELGTSFVNGSDVYEISDDTLTLIHKTAESTDPTFDLFGSAVCNFFGVSEEDCALFLTENMSDFVFVSNQIKIITEHKDIYGEDHPPEWYDPPLLGIGIFGILSPGISEGKILKNVGKKISSLIDHVKRFPSDFTSARHLDLIDAMIRGTPEQITAIVDAFKAQDWATFGAARDTIKNNPIDPLSRLGRLKNWVDELYKRSYLPKGTADSVAKKSGVLKKYAQTSMDYIRARAPWIPGQQYGDDVGGVLTEEELPAFRAMMDEIAKLFAEDGEYTRYIDPQEMAIYFKEHPEFFKEGYTNAIIDTTSHFDDADEIGKHITPLDEASAEARRVRWHEFILRLKNGLTDTFGETRGLQLYDELGLEAAKKAKDINKIIFKWGKRMWDDVYTAAKAADATDEEAEALAKIAANSHINIGKGIAGGAYETQWQARKGVIGWMQKHPLYTIILGIGGIGYLTRMIPWYIMDNMPFNIYMGREAGVIEKTFGDKEGEIVNRIETLGYQLRDFPCDTTVQTNFVELLTLLKELKDIADTTDPVPPGKIAYWKSLYGIVYGTSIGDPNDFMRKRVKIDYSTAYTEYVLRVTEAGCADPVEPPEGWNGVTGTGSIWCTSDAVCSLWLDDLYIGEVWPAGFAIAGVEPGSHTVKMTFTGKPDCVKTVTVVAGSRVDVNCQFEECPSVYSVGISYSPGKPLVNETIDFVGSATTGDDHAITDWLWTFGDFGESTDQNPQHRYASSGHYTVSLEATNDCGESRTKTDTIWVIEEPDEPDPGSASLHIKAPVDEDGNLIDHYWDTEIWIDDQFTKYNTAHSFLFGHGAFCDKYPPGNLIPCDFGTHKVTLKKTGFNDVSKTFNLRDGDSETWQPVMTEAIVGPKASIDSIDYPADPVATGTPISIATHVKNIGNQIGTFYVKYTKNHAPFWTSGEEQIASGATTVFDGHPSLVMGDSDISIVVSVWNYDTGTLDDVETIGIQHLTADMHEVTFDIPDDAVLEVKVGDAWNEITPSTINRLLAAMRRAKNE